MKANYVFYLLKRVGFALLLLGVSQMGMGQTWLGPYNHTGDLIPSNRPAIVDSEHNIHMIYYVQTIPMPPQGGLFHIKYSPTGELLIPPHQITPDGYPPYPFALERSSSNGIHAILLLGELYHMSLDLSGEPTEGISLYSHINGTISILSGLDIVVDEEFNTHVVYSTSDDFWPTVIYIKLDEQSNILVGPDTLLTGLPYYHVEFSLGKISNNRIVGCFSSVDGSDQFVQVFVIDQSGEVLIMPQLLGIDTSQVYGVGGKVLSTNRDSVVIAVSSNPISPLNDGRHELLLLNSNLDILRSRIIQDSIQGEAGAFGESVFESNGTGSILSVVETALQSNMGWQARAYIDVFDNDLERIEPRDSLPTSTLSRFGPLTSVVGSATEAVWMTAVPMGSPYARIYSWHHVFEPDSILAADERPFAEIIPAKFLLSTFPNPFNSILSISLDVPLHQEVTVSLYDLLGREVDVIYRGKLDNTTQSYTTPPSLASGIYFLRAATAAQTQTQKIVLLK